MLRSWILPFFLVKSTMASFWMDSCAVRMLCFLKLWLSRLSVSPLPRGLLCSDHSGWPQSLNASLTCLSSLCLSSSLVMMVSTLLIWMWWFLFSVWCDDGVKNPNGNTRSMPKDRTQRSSSSLESWSSWNPERSQSTTEQFDNERKKGNQNPERE